MSDFYCNNAPLRRLGNKNKMADKIISFFPDNIDCLISFFYGSGALENRFVGKIKYLIANDFDQEVANFYYCFTEKYQELKNKFELLPQDESIFLRWRKQKPTDPVLRAVAFLMLSNFSFRGSGQTSRFGLDNTKRITLDNLDNAYRLLANNPITTTQFMSVDFRDVLRKVVFRKMSEMRNSFIYADPPYFGTGNNYETPDWTESDLTDLLKIATESKIRMAISEFKGDFVLNKAAEFGLKVFDVCERRSLGNRNTEILLLNYDPKNEQKQLCLF
jgi:DNA adenine methylase